jgi:hypothetical protein
MGLISYGNNAIAGNGSSLSVKNQFQSPQSTKPNSNNQNGQNINYDM